MGYSMVHIDDIEPAGPGGAVRFIRRELGAEAFGINWFDIPPDSAGREHDETQTGQEEVNLVIRGSGSYLVDGEEVPVREGSVLRFDPETTRRIRSGADGLTMIAVGARRGSYEPHGPF